MPVYQKYPLVVDAGFDPFVRASWEKILRGEAVNFDFFLPSRQRAISLRAKLVKEGRFRREIEAENDLVIVRVSAKSPVLRALAPSIELAYDSETRRLEAFRGPGNIRDDSCRAQRVEIHYDYPHTQQQDGSESLASNRPWP